jgi:hypothetical protein
VCLWSGEFSCVRRDVEEAIAALSVLIDKETVVKERQIERKDGLTFCMKASGQAEQMEIGQNMQTKEWRSLCPQQEQ